MSQRLPLAALVVLAVAGCSSNASAVRDATSGALESAEWENPIWSAPALPSSRASTLLMDDDRKLLMAGALTWEGHYEISTFSDGAWQSIVLEDRAGAPLYGEWSSPSLIATPSTIEIVAVEAHASEHRLIGYTQDLLGAWSQAEIGTGAVHDLVYDSVHGRVTVLFCESETNMLWLRTRSLDSREWSEPVEPAPGANCHLNIALSIDTAGRAHVAWLDGELRSVFYAAPKARDGEWHPSTTDSQPASMLEALAAPGAAQPMVAVTRGHSAADSTDELLLADLGRDGWRQRSLRAGYGGEMTLERFVTRPAHGPVVLLATQFAGQRGYGLVCWLDQGWQCEATTVFDDDSQIEDVFFYGGRIGLWVCSPLGCRAEAP